MKNGSFENGWIDLPPAPGWLINQQPNDWLLSWVNPGEKLYGSNDVANGVPECVHKLATQLPPHEQPGGVDPLILDGNTVYKIFHNGASFGATLSQEVTGLVPNGEYLLTTHVRVHVHQLATEAVPTTDPYVAEYNLATDGGDGLRESWWNFTQDGGTGQALHNFKWATRQRRVRADDNGELFVSMFFKSKWNRPVDFFIDDISLDYIGAPVDPEPPEPVECRGKPREQYARTYILMPPNIDIAYVRAAVDVAYGAAASDVAPRWTVGSSADDAGIGDLDKRTVVVVNPTSWGGDMLAWFGIHYEGVIFVPLWAESPQQLRDKLVLYARTGKTGDEGGESPYPFDWYVWPTKYKVVTQPFGARPEYYGQFGLPGHEGVDIRSGMDEPVFSVCDGYVTAVDEMGATNYGKFVRVRTGKFEAIYAHLSEILVTAGEFLRAGDQLGLSGDTGNADGAHLHFTLKHDEAYKGGPMYIGYPSNIIDPMPYVYKHIPPPVNAPKNIIGLHASADPGNLYGGEAEFAEFGILKPGVVKVLSAHSRESIQRLALDALKNNSDTVFIVRAFLNFGGRSISPSKFVEYTIADVYRAFNTLREVGARDIYIEVHNEPNLVQEGLSTSWQGGFSFGQWMADVIYAYKQAGLIGVRYMAPGLSPGGNIDGVRLDSEVFLREMSSALGAVDATGIHAYWSSQYSMDLAVNHVKRSMALGKAPFFVTEASNNERANPPAADVVAREYVEFGKRLSGLVHGITYFVASASNALFHPECWIVDGKSKGIAALIRKG